MSKYEIFALFVTIYIVGAMCRPEVGKLLMQYNLMCKCKWFLKYLGESLLETRVTCDLLSSEAGGVKLNDAACAGHCLLKGKKGGHCNGGICQCRN